MLYHYTSATLLEKIITSGKLRPSNVCGWRLLWATSASTIDPTASCAREPIVARFTLHNCDFEAWTSVRSRYQQEELKKLVERMEQRVVADGVAPKNWYVRYASLSVDRWIRIDTCDQRWQPYVSKAWATNWEPHQVDDDALADYRYRHQTEEEEEIWEEEVNIGPGLRLPIKRPMSTRKTASARKKRKRKQVDNADDRSAIHTKA